ncbi:MAG: flagellin-like protein [Sphingomonas bacterium]|nr:flagellin-like protein [Sphingomonas bacterium]
MISGTSARITADIARQSALSRDIAKLQDQVSTGKKLATPSEDPAGNARLGAVRRTQANDDAYRTNVDAASAVAARADGAMASLSTALDRARELTMAASSGTYSADNRKIAAAELRGIAEDVARLSTQKDAGGQPLFPDGDPLLIPIADGTQVAATVSKTVLFGRDGASLSDIIGAAAAALELPDDADGTAATRATATATSLEAIDAASSRVAALHGEQGVRAARIDARAEALADSAITLADERTAIEGADVSAAISLITSKLNTLEAAQAVFAKLNRQTLFDLLG